MVPTLIAVWGMTTSAAGTIGTVTVVTSSFGGWFAGAGRSVRPGARIADGDPVVGRAVFTFLCSIAQNFEQLFIRRGLHGLGPPLADKSRGAPPPTSLFAITIGPVAAGRRGEGVDPVPRAVELAAAAR